MDGGQEPDDVELPAPTAAPLVLALGLTLVAAGVALSLPFTLVGAVLAVAALWRWASHLLPGRGHTHEPRVPPEERPRPVDPKPGTVERLREGVAGYRLRLPVEMQPLSAGVKGGIVGGLVMPIPALLYGVLSNNGIWFPVNLLAGLLLPGFGDMTHEQLKEFHLTATVIAVLVHAALSLGVGLMYGVLLPTLQVPGGPLVLGGIILPALWTGFSYGFMGVINPPLRDHVDWFWFVISQLCYGVAAAMVVVNSEKVPVPPAGSDQARA
jgi:hypothetical protein